MYRNKKYKSNKTKAPLKSIDENTTIKLPKLDKPENKENLSKTNEDKELFSQELEVIPASQEPTQRYLSQRSTLCRTQSKCSQRAPTSYFEMVLIKSGVNLDEPDNFVISCDHVTFVCRFREIFIKCQNYPSNVETFRTGLRDALNDKKLAMKLLSGCTIKMPGEDNTYQSQDSMIVNFLMIDFLQEVVITVVLNKVEECSKNETSTSNDVPLLPLMLSQLRYVTFSHADLIYSRIVEIFQNAVPSVQWDIIAHAEMVFQSTKHDAFVEILLNNFASNKDIFHSTTIRTFTNLCLSPRMQSKLRTKAVAYIKDGCPAKILPLLIKLLLKVLNEDNEEIIRGLINDLKDILMWEEYDRSNGEIRQSRIDVFNCISQGLTRSKKFFDIWQKTIQNLPPANFRGVDTRSTWDVFHWSGIPMLRLYVFKRINSILTFFVHACFLFHRPIDFVILLLMISIKEERSNYIENIIRRRIKLEHITVDILRKANAKYPDVLATQMNVLLLILHDFLRDRAKLISDFGRISYSIIFGLGESTQKEILMKLVELTCDKSASSMTTAALELIKELRASYPSNVQNWGMTLMPLLDRISEMTLPQTRLVMELLCSIAFPTPPLDECPALQDQIDMLVKKQIINRLPLVKKQGIIGAVQLIDCVARIEDTITEAMYDLNESYNTVEEIPDGRGKIAANYISRIHSTTVHCPESLALFYDELATVCSSNHKRAGKKAYLDRPFVVWLCELITYYFQNSFIVEDQPRDDLGISLSYQKCINTPDDTNSPNESELIPIAVNISQLVLVPSNEASSSILVLAPLFNLMRVLHFTRYDGSLEMINALLGCGIILPKFFDDINNADIFYEYDAGQCKHILDILFHTVNWIRETISSFSSQDDPMIRGKVLLRLAELIRIEENICKLLTKAPVDYLPPVCQFMNVSTCSTLTKKACTGKKKPPLKADDNRRKDNSTEQMGTELTMANITATNRTRIKNQKVSAAPYMDKFKTAYGPKETYRQMSPDIMLILKVNFNLKYPRPIEDIGKTIGLLEFKFIMTDIINKLESVTGVSKFSPDEQHQYIVYPKHFISDIITQFLEPILRNFQQISDAILEVVKRVDGALGNADLFTDEVNYLKICFGLCLRLLAALFSWSGFGDVSNEGLLKGALLAVLVKTTRRQCASKNISTIAVEAFKRCLTFESGSIDIKSAVHLYHLVQSLKQFAKEIDLKDTRNLCKKLLCRKWFNFDGTMERGSLCNVYLDELVKGYLKNSDFRRQENILKVILDETQYLKSKENSLKSFPNFNKANFPMLFRGLCETLISSLSDSAHCQSSGNLDRLIIWEKSCEILNSLLGIVQALYIPRNFVLFLKHAHFYLKIVLQHGLPVYEKYLRENPERVNDLLKSLQVTTRFLHNLCCHSKALKNTSIVSQIPVLRETVENLVFRVKALLAANKCSSVFWMGNLKNKDLHGDVILSQTASWSTANNANSDDEIPEDDASIEETILGDNDNSATGSNAANDSSRSTCF